LASLGTPDDEKKVRKEENAAKKSAHDGALQATSWVEEIQNEFAKRLPELVRKSRHSIRRYLGRAFYGAARP